MATTDSPTGTLPRTEATLDHVTKGRVRGTLIVGCV
jgi:hypothetical protein